MLTPDGRRGRFITFEGIDGAGKSTHLTSAVERLRRHGLVVTATREPGGTPLGETLRELLLREPMHLETETLLMFAARREHLAQLIVPALARGEWVVCDRFSDATYAYQGGGRGLEKAKLGILEHWVHGAWQPDLSFLFDLPPALASERIAAQTRSLDRFERERADFHARVRQAYLERAAAAPRRFVVIDATQTIAVVGQRIEETIERLLHENP